MDQRYTHDRDPGRAREHQEAAYGYIQHGFECCRKQAQTSHATGQSETMAQHSRSRDAVTVFFGL